MTLDQNPHHLVPEGDLPPGVRPVPGRRPERSVWTGIPDEAPTDELTAGQRARIVGLDAARGFALLGMIAVHTLPSYFESTGVPTLTWSLFAGHAAALFALLAGITLALLTGGRNPHRRTRLKLSRNSLVVRALLILVIGLLLNYLPIPVYNILPYYGLLFLLAIPFTRMGPLRLLLSAAVFAVAGPVIIHLVNGNINYEITYFPTFTSLYLSPAETVTSLLVGGTYPAVTWMAYICVGMALGRIDLSKLSVQIQLLATGAGLAVASAAASHFLLRHAGGWLALLESAGLEGTELIREIIVYGPLDFEPLPNDSWWWLAITGPHTNTAFSIGVSLGIALATLGTFLLLCRVWEEMLTPLIAAGSMTLTLYTAHMIFLALLPTDEQLGLWFVLQVGAGALFATVWHQTVGRGPLEAAVNKFSKQVGAKLTRTPALPAESGDHAGRGVHRSRKK